MEVVKVEKEPVKKEVTKEVTKEAVTETAKEVAKESQKEKQTKEVLEKEAEVGLRGKSWKGKRGWGGALKCCV